MRLIKSDNDSVIENFWTVTDVAEHLQVSEKTVYDWVHRRKIPFHKVGSLLRFRLSEISKSGLLKKGESPLCQWIELNEKV